MENLITITSILTFLGSGSVVAILITNLLKEFFDKYVNEKFKATVAQLILLTLSLIIAGIGIGWGYLPDMFKTFTALLFTSGISIYEVLKGFGIVTGKFNKVEKQ